MHETDLELEPNEASDLCRLEAPGLLERRGWDRAFVTVLDEAPAEECLAVLGHDAGSEPAEGWQALRVECRPDGGDGETHDAEACARRGGWIYLLGSQFGDKDGPLDPGRSWIARVREAGLAGALENGGRARLELALLDFCLHRAVNDALEASPIGAIDLGPETRAAYIDSTIEEGAKENQPWAGTVKAGDRPINVEGADFRAGGGLLLGLRYPASAEGHPLMVELEDVDSLFERPETPPRCTAVWVIEGIGSSTNPAGVRGLHTDDGRRFDAVVGDLDVSDYPEGQGPPSTHVRFELSPDEADGGPLAGETVHEFEDQRHVEGVASGGGGHVHYVVDRDGHVSLRTLLLES